MSRYEAERKRAMDNTSKIIDKVGPRLAGTKACTDAAEMIYDEMKTFSDETKLEEFVVHKGAFLGWIKILVSSYILSAVFLWLKLPMISLALTTISVVILVLQFFLYKSVIDPLYPSKKGLNVVGKIEPQNEVKNQIIISGHHDSARIFNFLVHQPKLYGLRVTGGISLVLLMFVFSLVAIFLPTTTFYYVVTIILTLGVLLTGQMWFFASKKGTPGAGDNLVSSMMAVEIGRYFSKNKLKNTRIIIASFDAEEEGLRGARAFAKTHEEAFKTCPTILLNTDCPYHLKNLFFLTSDINNSVPMSVDLAQELVDISQKKGYVSFHQPIAFLTGGTDAGELAKKGVKSTTLMAMPWSNQERSSVYHTPNDTIDSVEPEVIEAAIDIFISYVEKVDSM